MTILVTIGSEFFGHGVKFPIFPLTFAVALETLWHSRHIGFLLSVLILTISSSLACDSEF